MADPLPIGTKICKINGSTFRTKEKVATICGHLDALPQWKPANPKGDPMGRSAKRGPPKAYIIEDGSYIAADRVKELEG